MQFGQIIKDILNKDNAVWIPDFGLLRYEDGSSKLIIDQSSVGSEIPLLSLIAQRHNLNAAEAKTMMNNSISVMKSALQSQGKYTIDGIGDIIEFNNSYQVLESKKNIFPSDFFGMSNFDFNQNKTSTDFYSEADKQPFEEPVKTNFNAPPTIEVEKTETIIKNEPVSNVTPPIVEPTIAPTDHSDEMKSEMDGFIEDAISRNETPQQEKSESLFDSFMIKIKGTSKPKKEEPLAEEPNLFSTSDNEVPNNTIEHEVESIRSLDKEDDTNSKDHNAVQETVIEPIMEYDGINRLKEEIDEDIDEDEIEDEDDEEIEEEVYADDEPLETITTTYIDPSTLSRRNIGKATYDQGYYEHLVNKRVASTSNIRWNLVLPVLGLLLALAFFIPWLVASSQGKNFLGMAPLWGSEKKEEKKVVQAVPTTVVDTASVDSTTMTSTKDSSTKLTTSTIPKTEHNIATSTSPKVDKTSGIASNTSIATKENTPPKTFAADNSTAKKQKASTGTASASTKTKDSTKVSEVASSSSKQSKIPANVLGKPYATANYTKGNHYLSFGQFKLPKHASKLKKDLNRLGVETDVVLVDGTYRVVIPYTNKDKAVSAAKDYPNTSVFE